MDEKLDDVIGELDGISSTLDDVKGKLDKVFTLTENTKVPLCFNSLSAIGVFIRLLMTSA